VLTEEVRAGRLDDDAVHCVLDAAGHAVDRPRRVSPAGLSERELEVLCIIAKGSTIHQAARELHVSPKTIDAHVQHIYTKVGCTTRAGAAVFAMREGLLNEPL
jgi:DNA-binding NarL/FixJ family response regulator